MLNRTILVAALVLGTATLATCQQQRVGRAYTALDEASDLLARAESTNAALVRKLELAQGTTRTVTEYVDRVQVVRERGATIVKEVPVYVTATADSACTVPAGFVHLHDAAASGDAIAGFAGDPDAPAAGVTLSAVAETTAANYATYHGTVAQVIGLQTLVQQLHDALQQCDAP